jgi:lipopolysaccharide/colanic/teichoic acid biosynthesis glycosyltransferase
MDELTRGTLESHFPVVVDIRQTRVAAPSRRAVRAESADKPASREVVKAIEAPRVTSDGSLAAADVIPRDRSEALSRAMNLTLASIGLLLAMPVCVLIAVLIKVTSRGPILYVQTRVGCDRRWRRTLALQERRVEDLGGQVFTIYKFRTMRVDAERHSGAVWAQEHDPRVSALGRYLRILRLDELPQMWNVIRGDMNIVGPRPERPSIVARLREVIPEYRYRHRVKPGLTGLAQINQNYDSNIDDVRSKVRWDLRYIEQRSLWLDLKIILRTVPAILMKYRGW